MEDEREALMMNGLTVLFGMMDEAEKRASENGHRIDGWAVEGYESASTVCVDCGASLTVLRASKEVKGMENACLKRAKSKAA